MRQDFEPNWDYLDLQSRENSKPRVTRNVKIGSATHGDCPSTRFSLLAAPCQSRVVEASEWR